MNVLFSEIERVCENADFEIDLSSGDSWYNELINQDGPTIIPQYLFTHNGLFIRPPANPEEGNNCNLSVVMRIDMTKYSAGTLKHIFLKFLQFSFQPCLNFYMIRIKSQLVIL